MDKNLIIRSISGIFYTAIVVFCTHPIGAEWLSKVLPEYAKQQYLFFGLISLFFLIGLWECIKIMSFGKGYEKWVVFPLAGFLYYQFAKRFFLHDFYFNFRSFELLAMALIILAVVTLFRFTHELYQEAGKLIFSVIYVTLPFGFALGLPHFSDIQDTFSLEVFFLFILIWSSDTFAYLSGKMFGKHKMAPKISPKKTWEGFAGGVLLTLILSFFIEKFHGDLRGNWLVVGLLVAVFAPLGDLVESQLKRTFGVKDSGNIIPGHGGILDRLDSFMICVPVVYLYFIIINFF